MGSPGTQSFTLTVLGFHISTTTLPDGVAGQAYSQQLSTQGGNPALGTVTWKKVSLPKGLALSSTGLLSGVPSIKAVGPTAGVDVSATLGHKGQVVTATIPFTINAAPTFGKKPVVAAAFTEGTPGSVTIAATGSPTPTIAESGPLPSGVTFNNGVISGTPAVTVNSAVYSLTITASNGIAPAATETFTLTVYAPLAVTSPVPLPPAMAGVAYGGASFTATGANGIYAWKKVSVPKGLAISSGGVLSGTPKSAGSDTVTVEVESKDGKVKVSKDYSLHLTVQLIWSVPIHGGRNTATQQCGLALLPPPRHSALGPEPGFSGDPWSRYQALIDRPAPPETQPIRPGRRDPANTPKSVRMASTCLARHVQVTRKLSLCVRARFRLTWLPHHERTLLTAGFRLSFGTHRTPRTSPTQVPTPGANPTRSNLTYESSECWKEAKVAGPHGCRGDRRRRGDGRGEHPGRRRRQRSH